MHPFDPKLYPSDETICAHLGDEIGNSAKGIVPPVYLTSLHTFDNLEDLWDNDPNSGKYSYGRSSNPTVETVERTVAALERGDRALCFGSGMAAITSAIMNTVKSGDHIVAVRTCYGPAQSFMNGYLSRLNIEVTWVKGRDPADFDAARRPNTRLFYLESPASLTFMAQDLRAVAAIAKAHGITTLIDNTLGTSVYQKPLTLGIDMSVHTMSKYIGGHGDIIGGILITDNERALSIQKQERQLFGGILGPMEGFLARRGLRTLPARLRQHGENALKVARYLEAHPKVARVLYTGLPSHPDYALLGTQMTGHAGLMSVVFKTDEMGSAAIVNKLKLFRIGVSWGGHESLALLQLRGASPEMLAQYGIDRPCVRLHIGLDNADDLMGDLEQAMG